MNGHRPLQMAIAAGRNSDQGATESVRQDAPERVPDGRLPVADGVVPIEDTTELKRQPTAEVGRR